MVNNFVVTIIAVTVAVIIGSAVLIPMVKQTTSDVTYNENLVCGSGENQTDTLTMDNLVSGSLTITGLTLTTNYTVNYTSGLVSFVNGTTPDTYPSEYSYYSATYIDNVSERALMGVIVLAFIIGIVAWLFMQFGMV
jgi:hypothetical protein